MLVVPLRGSGASQMNFRDKMTKWSPYYKTRVSDPVCSRFWYRLGVEKSLTTPFLVPLRGQKKNIPTSIPRPFHMGLILETFRANLTRAHEWQVYSPSGLRVRIHEKREELSLVDFGVLFLEFLGYTEVFAVDWPVDRAAFSFLLYVEDGNAAIRDGVDDSQRSQANRHSS